MYAAELDRHLGELAHHFIEAAAAARPIGRSTTRPGPRCRLASGSPTRTPPSSMEGRWRRWSSHASPTVRGASTSSSSSVPRQIRASRVNDARATLKAAADLARELDQPERMAQAVLGMVLLGVAGVVDDELIELLDESLDAVGPDDSSLRAQLLTGLAQELYWVDAAGRSNDAGVEALEMARRIGDSEALAFALIRRQFTGPVDPEETRRRLRDARRAPRPGQAPRRPRARAAGACLPAARRARGRRDRRGRRRHGRLRAPRQGASPARPPVARAGAPGDAGAGRRAVRRCGAADRRGPRAGNRAEESIAVQFYGVQVALLRRLRRSESDVAGLDEMVAGLADLAERFPAIPAWRCSLAATHAELGHENETRVAFESLAANDFANLPLDAQWGISLALLAEAAVFLEDVPRARIIHEHLLPYDGLNLVAGRAAACYGPVARVLGTLAVVTGRLDDAERHFTDAIAMSERMGDRPFTALGRFGLADALLKRNRRGRPRAGGRAAHEALDSAQELGMVQLVNDALAARLEAQGISLDASTSIDFMIGDLTSEQPDIAAHAAPDGQVTILFSDIENSTLMTERLGDERWLRGPARPQRALPPPDLAPTAASRSRTRATASCWSSPTRGRRSSARPRSSAGSPRASWSRARRSGSGWGCTPARRSARRATSSAAA